MFSRELRGNALTHRRVKIGLTLVGIAAIASAFARPLGERSPQKLRAASVKFEVRPFALLDHECNHFGLLVCPSSSSAGALTAADCRLNDGSYIDFVQFQGTAGQTVTIDMTSNFDTYLFLLDPVPMVVAQNDDLASGNTNSRIVFTLTASGTWTVGANSFAPNVLGDYSLSMQCASGPAPTPTPTPTPPGNPTPTPTPTVTPVPGPCVADGTTLCLNNGRFRVQTRFATTAGQTGNGQTVSATSDTGMFWFFSPNNLEAIVKVVNGCSFNQRYWVFMGGLTNVMVTTTVTDTQTGILRTYVNPQGTAFQPIQDTAAFATCP